MRLIQLLSSLSIPLAAFASYDQQIPMNAFNPPLHPPVHYKPLLSDLLTIESSASIFYSYARELELSRILSDTKAKITVLAPTNKAVMSLARKPHESPKHKDRDDIKITEKEFDLQSKQNVERWVSSHIIPKHPIALNSTEEYPTMLHKKSIKFTPVGDTPNDEVPEWRLVTLEDGVRIVGMKEGLNGVLYMIDGTVSP